MCAQFSFIDTINGNGTTMKEPGEGGPVFNIVVRGSILQETLSDFLTRKERGCFLTSDSGITSSVEAGSLPALLYVFLHEGVHVVDISYRTGLAGVPRLFPAVATPQLTKGIWANERTATETYRSPLLDAVYFRTGKPQSMADAKAGYEALARTPFLSL